MYSDVYINPKFQIFNQASEYVGILLGKTKNPTLALDEVWIRDKEALYLFKKIKAVLVVFKFNFSPINAVLDVFLKQICKHEMF